VFDLRGPERLAEWKRFRDSLESSDRPLNDVSELWSRAPFVSPFLNPNSPEDWPDPWHLVLDNRLDNLAIMLGMLYTLKLTNRFMEARCEIHKSMSDKEKDSEYFLIVGNEFVLDGSREVKKLADLNVATSLVWSK
jgi:hypothetical protein